MGMRFSLSLSAVTTASEAGVKDLDSPEHDKCCGFRNAEVRKTQVYVLAVDSTLISLKSLLPPNYVFLLH